MFRSISILVVVVAAALAVFSAGCGGGESTTALTKAEFIKKGDAICAKLQTQASDGAAAYMKKNFKTLSNLSVAKLRAKLAVNALPLVSKEAEELETLGAPDGDEAEVEAIVAGIEEGVKKAEADPESVEEFGSDNPFHQAGELARKYGFDSCAEVL